MKFVNNNNLCNLINYYKNSDINKNTLESELGRELTDIYYVDAIVDELNNQNNSSYISMVIPKKVNESIKLYYVIDNNVILNILSPEKTVLLLSEMKNFEVKGMMTYLKFLNDNKDTEISFLDCIEFYIRLYLSFLTNLDLTEYPELSDFFVFLQNDIKDVLLAIENGTETSEKIVNHILLKHILPEFALKEAENMFKELNVPQEKTEEPLIDQTQPKQNVMFADMTSKSNGYINPEWRTDIDPFYDPQ